MMTKVYMTIERKSFVYDGISIQRLLQGIEFGLPRYNIDVGATHSKSSASQSQPRNHQLLSNGSVSTYLQRWNPWIYNLLLGKPYNNTCFPSGPTQGYITGDQTKWGKTAADVVHLCTVCIWNIKDLYEEVNRGYLFTLWHNLRRWRHDTHIGLEVMLPHVVNLKVIVCVN
jgi:hypothetical protein